MCNKPGRGRALGTNLVPSALGVFACPYPVVCCSAAATLSIALRWAVVGGVAGWGFRH